LVLVTNGSYSSGGRAAADSEINRVTVDKPLAVRSVNGPEVTIINGGQSVRCAYLASGAKLYGFTLRNGVANYGAGVFCKSASAVVSNCVVADNSAASSGSGAQGGTLNNCRLSGNRGSGVGAVAGGAANCTLNNCTLSANLAFW